MKSINVNGCSICQPGSENYCTFITKIPNYEDNY